MQQGVCFERYGLTGEPADHHFNSHFMHFAILLSAKRLIHTNDNRSMLNIVKQNPP